MRDNMAVKVGVLLLLSVAFFTTGAAQKPANPLDGITEYCCYEAMELKPTCQNTFNFGTVMKRCVKKEVQLLNRQFQVIPDVKVTKKIQTERYNAQIIQSHTMSVGPITPSDGFMSRMDNFNPLGDRFMSHMDNFDPLANIQHPFQSQVFQAQPVHSHRRQRSASYRQGHSMVRINQGGSIFMSNAGQYSFLMNRNIGKFCRQVRQTQICYEIDLSKIVDHDNDTVFSQLQEPENASDCPSLVQEFRTKVQPQIEENEEKPNICY